MTERDTSRPGPTANFVFAAVWAALGVWTALSPGPAPLRWIQLLGYAVMTALFVALGLRRARAARNRG